MLHLLQICVCFVMRETSCCLFLTVIKPRLSTSLSKFYHVFSEWFGKYIIGLKNSATGHIRAGIL